MDTVGQGKEGEGEMYRESNTETYITICKIANGNLLLPQGTQTGAL